MEGESVGKRLGAQRGAEDSDDIALLEHLDMYMYQVNSERNIKPERNAHGRSIHERTGPHIITSKGPSSTVTAHRLSIR